MPRMPSEPHRCPICQAPIRRGRLMCLKHWAQVPRAEQLAVNVTWRGFKRSEMGEAAIMALSAYRQARDAAIAAVAALEEVSW